ncbi:hypothetical protein RJ640_008672 [Escallonia rubra]|uniref:PGG domain-containing protein n=1 Tax=Escallonia rubra TaxID=112253 RepID=A0AA88QIP0_9ASTE|nr:hypothetical protein RJ640_008672 [Escallonia rubra]
MSVPKKPSLLGEEEEEEIYGTAESMDPQLYRAATEGDILEFIKAMERVVDDRHHSPPATCVQLGPQNNTVLHIATSFHNYEIVKLICKDLPFFAAEKNARGDTPLHIAARDGDCLLVNLIVDSDFREHCLGEKNKVGNTALHEALHHHHEEVARILIDRNRNLSYTVNKEGKSLLYLAAEAGYAGIVKLLMENPIGNYTCVKRKLKNKSPVHAAILGRNIDVLRILWETDQSSFQLKGDQGRNPLHFAADIGYVEGVNFLIHNFCASAYQRDKHGLFPIHIASSKGHTDIVQEILSHCPDSRDLLSLQGHNVLHITAMSGNTKALSKMLKIPELEKLVNEKDEDGNTPLHVATIHLHPKIVSTLTRDAKVSLKLQNNEGSTAFDIAECYMEKEASFVKRLTWMALKIAGAPRSKGPKIKNSVHEQTQMENCRDKVNFILVVAMLVAAVTFAAGFTIPGGYNNNSNPNQGNTTMLKKVKFQIYVISNTVAMHSSIIVAVTLLWAELGDSSSMHVALKFAIPLLGIALFMMSMTFMAGVYLIVSTLSWLANVIQFTSFIFVFILVLLYVPLCFLGSSNYHIFHRFSYYPFRLMLYAFGNCTSDDAEA